MLLLKLIKQQEILLLVFQSEASYVDYLIQEDVLKGIHVPDTAIYLFSDYINDAKSGKIR
jgi:hypothetical protein